jgi:O-succinylbenzoic acid--CoA ligase
VNEPESWIERAARLHPDRSAVLAPDGTLTYAQLARASWHVAAQLIERAAAASHPHRPVDVIDVALVGLSGVRFASALHGCLRAGLVAVPIDPRLPAAEQQRRIAGCALRVAADDDCFAVLDGAGASPVPPPSAPHRALAGVGDDAARPAVRLYTSGSTGPGTPVLLSRGALLWNAIGSAAALGQPPNERWLSAMPVAHVGGLTVLTRSAIGATTAVVRSRFDVDEQLALLMAGAATITSVVPTMLGRLLDAGLHRPPALRLVLLGGAPITPELAARAADAGVPVAATYGMTETCAQVVTAGAPLFCTRAALRSERRGASGVAPIDGADDEILVRGPTLGLGLAGADGWFATGDRGARTTDGPERGELRVTGRLAETIITGGENVAPSDVESRLVAQPGIADAAVLGVPDADWGERVEARVVLSPGATLDVDAVRAALREQLPPFAIPKVISVVAALPRTPTGKLRRAELR